MSLSELQHLELTIQGLESQRALLGDAVTDAALGPLRRRLATLRAGPAVQQDAQVLKHVSILFTDVVGSTSLAQHLDAEEVSAVGDLVSVSSFQFSLRRGVPGGDLRGGIERRSCACPGHPMTTISGAQRCTDDTPTSDAHDKGSD